MLCTYISWSDASYYSNDLSSERVKCVIVIGHNAFLSFQLRSHPSMIIRNSICLS